MNIPDEVLREASGAYGETYVDAYERVDSRAAAREAEQAKARVIAEWARKEALREVREAIGRLPVDHGPIRMSHLLNEASVYKAIRALEEAKA